MQKMDISSLEDTKVEVVTKDDGTPALEMTLHPSPGWYKVL